MIRRAPVGRIVRRDILGARFVGDQMDSGTQGAQAPADLAWLRGVDAYTMGAYPQAEEEFRAAVRLDPGMADGWLGLHALRVDTTTALLRMYRHRERFGEQRTATGAHSTPGTGSAGGCSRCWRARAICCSRTPRTGWTAAMFPSWTGRSRACRRWTRTRRSASHACRSYLVKDWEQLVRNTEQLMDDPLLGIEADSSAAWHGCAWRCTGRPSRCSPPP